MISSVKAHSFAAPAAASRAKPSTFKLAEFDEPRVEEVAGINPSGGQDGRESFSFNDLSQKAANLVIEAEVEAAQQNLAVEAGAEPEMSGEEISGDFAKTADLPDFGDHPGNGGESNIDSLMGGQDRRAAGATEHDAPPQGSLADEETVVANDFAPAPGLDVVTGRQDMRHAARAYDSVLATIKASGMRPGDVLDSQL